MIEEQFIAGKSSLSRDVNTICNEMDKYEEELGEADLRRWIDQSKANTQKVEKRKQKEQKGS